MSAGAAIENEVEWVDVTPKLGDWVKLYLRGEPGLFKRMNNLDPARAEGVEFIPGRDGGWGVRRQGMVLDSIYAPYRYARDLVSKQNLNGAEIVVVLGAAGGAVPLEVYEATRDSEALVVVLEPDPVVLKGMFLRNPQIADIPPGKLQFFTSIHQIKLLTFRQYNDMGALLCVCPPVYLRHYRDVLGNVLEALQEAAVLAKINVRTGLVRAKQWVHNLLQNTSQNTHYPSLFHLKDKFKDVPVVLAAAGPSLDKNVALLKAVQDKALICCVNTSLKALLAAGVKPHLVLSLEGLDVSSHFEGADISDLNLALCQTCHPALFKLPAERIFTFVDSHPAHVAFTSARLGGEEGEGLSAGGCIANAAFSAARMMGCNPMILIGQDLAYTNNQAYASGTVFEDMHVEQDENGGVKVLDPSGAKQQILDASEIGAQAAAYNENRELIPIKAWDGQSIVRTSPDFNLFRYWFQETAFTMHEDEDDQRTLYNATEGGAWIEGFSHSPLKTVIEEHIQDRPSRDLYQEVKDAWRRAPRISNGDLQDSMKASLRACEKLTKASRVALDHLKVAEQALEVHGPDSPQFGTAMEKFTKKEGAVSAASKNSVLVNAYVRATIKRLELRPVLSEEADIKDRWAENLSNTRKIQELIQQAGGELVGRIREVQIEGNAGQNKRRRQRKKVRGKKRR